MEAVAHIDRVHIVVDKFVEIRVQSGTARKLLYGLFQYCLIPVAQSDNITVIHENAFQIVAASFCTENAESDGFHTQASLRMMALLYSLQRKRI
jgi:hypothetical protein